MLSFRVTLAIAGSFLSLILSVSAYAAQNADEYAAVITFSDTEDAKWAVDSAYATVFLLSPNLNELNKLAIKSLRSGYYYDDQKFQQKKTKVDQTLLKQSLSFHLFGQRQVSIDIRDDGQNNHYTITIPAMSFSELGLDEDNVLTINNALTSEKHLKEARVKLLNILLPSMLKNGAVIKGLPSTDESLNTFKIKHVEGAKACINSLDHLYYTLSKQLGTMQDLAHKAASGKHSSIPLELLNVKFQNIKLRLHSSFGYSTSLEYNKLFNDNVLTFNLNGEKRRYYLPTLSLAAFKLDKDTLLDINSSMESYSDIARAKRWVRDWSITGVERLTSGEDKDLVKLTDEENALIQKKVNE